jgi:phosphoserine aminotransferase
MDRVKENNETDHYNSLTLINSMMDKWQTSCTPNVLGIYLLMRVLKDSDNIKVIEDKLINRYHAWSKFIKGNKMLDQLVSNAGVRSYTVVAMKMKEGQGDIADLKKKAKHAGFLLGEGYGDLKKDTFRIANFPAIRRKEIQKLMRFLLRHT